MTAGDALVILTMFLFVLTIGGYIADHWPTE